MNQFIESLVDCQLCCKTITVELQQLFESQLQNNNNKKRTYLNRHASIKAEQMRFLGINPTDVSPTD